MSSKVRIELDHAGVRSLLRSPEALQLMETLAQQAAGRLGEGYEVSSMTGSGRVNASIAATSAEARQENLETNSILKALL